MRILSLMSAMMAAVGLLAAKPTVTAQQRYPWNGKVDIVVTINLKTAVETTIACGG